MIIERNILLDWLSFTLPFGDKSIERVYTFFGEENIKSLDKGGMGYANSASLLDGGRIYWDYSRPDMGIHVSINSRSLALIETTAMGIIMRAMDWGASISRVDLAFDDFDGLLDIERMYNKLKKGECATRWRKITRIESCNLGKKPDGGGTLNVGSRTSRAFLRIYDKLSERRSKGYDIEGVDHWVRVELELKGDKAEQFALAIRQIALGKADVTSGELCASVLLAMIDFKEPVAKDSNKSRWPTSEWWTEFVSVESKIGLSVPKTDRSIQRSKAWVSKSVSATLAMIILSEYDEDGKSGFDFLIEEIVKGEGKLKKYHYDILTAYQQEMISIRGGNDIVGG